MDAFITRKKRKSSPSPKLEETLEIPPRSETFETGNDGEESTDIKLAMLSSLHPNIDQQMIFEVLLAHEGSVEATTESLSQTTKKKTGVGAPSQTSLRSFAIGKPSIIGGLSSPSKKKTKLLARRGATLHLYDPQDVSEHTPCTIIHNFLPPEDANRLLVELLEESKTYEKITFKLFDNVVSSPHTSSFYVRSYDELDQQKYEYVYNGARLTDVRKITPQLDNVKTRVEEAVNREIQERISTCYGGKKLKYQSPKPWRPNAAFVNCYQGPQESVGWHSDQLTYLGPRAVIGSLSLGVTREFRVRRVLPKDNNTNNSNLPSKVSNNNNPLPEDTNPDASEGQIAIHLPHNSLLVMHAEMQEEWKHSVLPAHAIDPHPVSGNRRINITYRDYREAFHPRYTPKCGCGVATVLRVVQKKRENWGRYFWMCHAGNVPGKESCTFFQWAEFTDDGDPIWKGGQK
ncbi:GRF zinc finger domain-containing protein [Podospora didyma]|uniref:GRF zinc finger domain-containing protein n=1 Tax=Podospora didyma TaxID=330526 RepID=A0AAE0P0Q0_9PEZI|nr:GRF zinc finger domain-containing protein [Podospora didyma]